MRRDKKKKAASLEANSDIGKPKTAFEMCNYFMSRDPQIVTLPGKSHHYMGDGASEAAFQVMQLLGSQYMGSDKIQKSYSVTPGRLNARIEEGSRRLEFRLTVTQPVGQERFGSYAAEILAFDRDEPVTDIGFAGNVDRGYRNFARFLGDKRGTGKHNVQELEAVLSGSYSESADKF